jgi:hypothetical protein
MTYAISRSARWPSPDGYEGNRARSLQLAAALSWSGSNTDCGLIKRHPQVVRMNREFTGIFGYSPSAV